ncbi:hypothetical protein B0H14DRAFT_2579705 [Mycena olivaceomarginata]|nr:hypothetical protein B0H14DRAFT_2579705 [Mycena olivaceomarginata]
MKLSISGLVALAIAAPALGAVVARIEGEFPEKYVHSATVSNVMLTFLLQWLSIKQGITYHNSTDVVPRAGPEIVTCYGSVTKADRAAIISVIDDWCGRVIGTSVANNQEVWVGRSSLQAMSPPSSNITPRPGTTTAPSRCASVVKPSTTAAASPSTETVTDSSVFPSTAATLAEVNGKQGGYETDLCGQWTTDPGSNGSDN